MMKIKIVLITLICFLFINTGLSQDEYDDFYYEEGKEQSFKDRLFFGGNFGLSFSNNISYIEVSPLIGFWVTDELAVGTGPIYQYYKNEYYKLKLNIYGGRVYSRYILFRNFFIHAEEQLTFNKYDLTTGQTTDDNNVKAVNDLLVGGGLRMPIGQRSSINLVLLYNLTESDYSLNSNPVIRVDFNF